MKSSQYNIYFEVNGVGYVYNTLTTAILSIPQCLENQLKEGRIEKISPQDIDVLEHNGIVVDNLVDERSIYEHFYRTIQFGAYDRELRVVVLPTFRCNLHCSYCFEGDQEGTKLESSSLSPILAFTQKELKKRHYQVLRFVLFGGEPLIFKDACIALTTAMHRIASSLNISFEPQIITNGVLLDERIIREMIVPYKMRVQLTVDGGKQTHDSKRSFYSGRGTYEIIKEKILLLNSLGCKDLIDLRVNVDKNNIKEFGDVIKTFKAFCGYIYPGLLRPIGGNACNADSCIKENDYILHVRPKLYEQMGRKQESISFGKKKPCGFNRSNSYIISPSLDVYKCENLIGRKEYAIGSINADGELIKNAEYSKQSTWSPFRFNKCNNCKLLPACASECPFQGIVENGTYEEPLCSTDEETLIRILKAYVLDNG